MPVSQHFLSLEGELIDRLKDELDESCPVLTAAQMANMTTPQAPAVYVAFESYRPGERKGSVLPVEQTWQTVLVIRNNKTLTDVGMRDQAGPLLSDIIAALYRWSPEGFRPLDLAPAPSPVYEGGFAFFPLAWTATLRVQEALCESD